MVLAGGYGTRFWPASRKGRPKPFVPLLGERTLLDATLERLRRVAPAERTWLVTSRDLASLARVTARDHPGVRVLLEPEGRNTAAAILWATAHVAARTADPARDVVGVFPADHHIPDRARFAADVRIAARTAARGEEIVLIGIPPTRADTAYGYIRIGAGPTGEPAPVRRFVEKPDRTRARRYLRSGGYLWNAGMLVATPERILAEARAHAPSLWRALGRVVERTASGAKVAARTLAAAYRACPDVSFDYAVLERSSRVRALRARFAWSDLGSWDALAGHLPKRGGNRVLGASQPILLDSRENVIWNTTDRAVVLLGVEGLVLVDTPDALLVCPVDRAQEVRGVVDELSRRGRGELA